MPKLDVKHSVVLQESKTTSQAQ